MPNNTECDCRKMRQSQILTTRQAYSSDMRRDRSMPCNMNHEHFDDSFPVGMAYVPWQKWQNIYEPHEALSAGTLFKDLDLRFYGVRRCR